MYHVNLFVGGMVRVAGSNVPKMVRHSGDGYKSARGHGRRQEKGTEQWAYDDGYIIDDENDQLSANWDGRKTPLRERLRMDNSTLSAPLSFLRYTYYRNMSDEGREQGLVAGCGGWVAKYVRRRRDHSL